MTVVGIDLGTTNTVVAAVRHRRLLVLEDEQGRKLLPSVVNFHPNGDVVVGHRARERRVIDAKNTVFNIKRLLGRPYHAPEVAEARQRFAFELRQGPGDSILVATRHTQLTLPELSSYLLQRAKQLSERALGTPVTHAVITVPANFNDLQRAATKTAAKIAGLDVVRVLNEPTAAALAYGIGKQTTERIVVYDYGGGTFDCSLLELSGNVFEVLATSGNSFLGGEDIDAAIANKMADELLTRTRLNARENPELFDRLRLSAELVKIKLSSEQRAMIRIADVGVGPKGVPIHFEFALTRSEFEALALPHVQRTIDVCREVMQMANMTPSTFDRVILVGGSSRIPLVQRAVAHYFGSEPNVRIHPEEVVAMGAAIQGAVLSEHGHVRSIPPAPRGHHDSVTQTLSHVVERDDVPTSTAALAHEPVDSHPTQPNEWPSDDSISLITPDASSSPHIELEHTPAPSGAHAAPIWPELPPPVPLDPNSTLKLPQMRSVPPPTALPATLLPVLMDVTPRALLVETAGGFSDTVVARNVKIPCERARVFTTASDRQTMVRVRVAQGETSVFAQNTYLGEVVLSGLRVARRGEVGVEVKFEVDPNGSLQVSATELETGNEVRALLQLVGIDPSLTLDEMIERTGQHVAP